ncbi:terminase small subunit protein [Cupriavidus taiwanensis]|uniref:terminase small subunit-like protein n=1 Tax=Cupriavidus taiwanensis TaxID=164546 RepID=UPI000E1225D7|nr:terminase small subunit protein [Cupriavidus taiwanensis]SPA44613.1 Phage terminase, small subunit [Cupriavidus taiwanensis]
MARPSEFSQEVADAICERIAEGESLRAICAGDDMPNKATVFRWLAADRAFSDQYARARECQADALADEIVYIADTPQMGQKSVSKATGVEITEGDMIEHRRLQVDARKWMAGKLAPKKYGDKIQQQLTGADGGPIQSETVTMTAEDAYKRMLDGGA